MVRGVGRRDGVFSCETPTAKRAFKKEKHNSVFIIDSVTKSENWGCFFGKRKSARKKEEAQRLLSRVRPESSRQYNMTLRCSTHTWRCVSAAASSPHWRFLWFLTLHNSECKSGESWMNAPNINFIFFRWCACVCKRGKFSGGFCYLPRLLPLQPSRHPSCQCTNPAPLSSNVTSMTSKVMAPGSSFRNADGSAIRLWED